MGYYSVRRPCPFQGPLQLAEVEGARAVSADGQRWQLELLARLPSASPPWGDMGGDGSDARYFTVGEWTPLRGLKAHPVNVLLGDQSAHPSLEPLLAALESHPALPFPPADNTELWLQDREGQPLALLASLVQARPLSGFPVPRWRAYRETPIKPSAGVSPAPPPQRELEALMREAAGDAPRTTWVRREGPGVCAIPLDVPPTPSERPPGAFPELPWRTVWDDPRANRLMAGYTAWQAPRLLTLFGLSQDLREELEHLACQQPHALYTWRGLIPEFADQPCLRAAMVQSVIQSRA